MTTQPAAPSAGVSFDFAGFISQTVRVLTAPADFFKSMPKTGNIVEPIIAAAIYGFIGGIISAIWSVVGLTAVGGVGGGAVGSALGLSMIILGPIFAIVGLFIGAVIFLVISAIGGGSTDFVTCLRVTAACMALYPVRALVGFLPFINFFLGLVVSLLVGFYGLWLAYNGLVHALNCSDKVAKIVCAILAVISIIFGLAGYAAARAARAFSQGAATQSEEWKKAAAAWEKAGKELEKSAQDAQQKVESEAQKVNAEDTANQASQALAGSEDTTKTSGEEKPADNK